jgi:hypothetical protein
MQFKRQHFLDDLHLSVHRKLPQIYLYRHQLDRQLLGALVDTLAHQNPERIAGEELQSDAVD